MIRSISSESLAHTAVCGSHASYRPLPARPRKPDTSPWLTAVNDTASYLFLFSNFRYYLTLFSKFFSSFPHGTCSLSVSHRYLALDGIYHPLRAAIPNNSTLGLPNVSQHSRHERGFHPPRRSFPGNFARRLGSSRHLQTTTPKIFSLSWSRFTRSY